MYRQERALERKYDWAASRAVLWTSLAFVAILFALALIGCGPTPPVVSGDTYCERARHISATSEQRGVIVKDESLWRSLVKQIADHNDTYMINCTIPDIVEGK